MTRPSINGPLPEDIIHIIAGSARIRKMTHSAEELTCFVLEHEYGIINPHSFSEVLHGFVLEFDKKPDFSIPELEQKVKALIDKSVPIDYHDDSHITIDGILRMCTGPRIHLKNTGDITHYHLHEEFYYNSLTGQYSLIGTVDLEGDVNINHLNQIEIL